MFQIFITEATVQTLSLITILFLQLYQRLTIRRTDNRKEEKLICFADKFFSKTRPTQEKTLDEARRSIVRFGEEGALRFEGWVNKFM